MRFFQKLFSSVGQSAPASLAPAVVAPVSLKGLKSEMIVDREIELEVSEFVKIAKHEYGVESLGFLFAMKQYNIKARGGVYKIPQELYFLGVMIPASHFGGANTMGKWIYENYIPGSAKFQINISSAVRARLDSLYKDYVLAPPDFDEAVDQVQRMINAQWLRG